jgi:hypothetical protein
LFSVQFILFSVQLVLFSVQLVFGNISDSEKNWPRYDHKCTWVFTWSIRYSCQIWRKSFKLKAEFFHVDAPTDRQTDTHTDMTKLIIFFVILRNAPKSCFFNSYFFTKIFTHFFPFPMSASKVVPLIVPYMTTQTIFGKK